jgi:hypothetical protein
MASATPRGKKSSPVETQPQMHPALKSAEILSSISDHLSTAYHSNLVTVNKQWTNVALRLMWQHVHDIGQLLSILCVTSTRSEEPHVSLSHQLELTQN